MTAHTDTFGSDAVWDMIERYENAEKITNEEIRALSHADRVIFSEEVMEIIARNADAADRRSDRKSRDPRIGISCPGAGPDYEGRILAQAERRYFEQ